MPRTVMNDVPWFCVWTMVMFGVSAMKSCGRTMPADSISAALNALTATGTSWRDSSRLRAVMITSARGSDACASSGGAATAATNTPSTIALRAFFVVMRTPPAGSI